VEKKIATVGHDCDDPVKTGRAVARCDPAEREVNRSS